MPSLAGREMEYDFKGQSARVVVVVNGHLRRADTPAALDDSGVPLSKLPALLGESDVIDRKAQEHLTFPEVRRFMVPHKYHGFASKGF